MKTAPGQRACLMILTLVAALGLSGCTIGGKSFSIDSNSRIPFFGLELKERKPKSTGPTYNSISRTNSDGLRIEAALGAGSSTPPRLLNSKNRPLAAAVVSEGHGDSTNSTGNRQSATSLELPITENLPSNSGRNSRMAAMDFQ